MALDNPIRGSPSNLHSVDVGGRLVGEIEKSMAGKMLNNSKSIDYRPKNHVYRVKNHDYRSKTMAYRWKNLDFRLKIHVFL